MAREFEHQPRLGDYFTERKQHGEPGLPTLSVTMHDGLVPRNTLERRTESNLSAEDHLLVEPGDIAYNMMRMWQGASGLVDRRANVSPAYVVMTPNSNLDPEFAKHWLKSARVLHLLWAYSHGMTNDRLRLYADDFESIPLTPPMLKDQKRIAAVLDIWDKKIETTKKLIEIKNRKKIGFLSKIIDQSSFERDELENFCNKIDKKISVYDNYVGKFIVELEDVEPETGRLIHHAQHRDARGLRNQFNKGDVLYGKLRPYLKKFLYAERDGLCSTEIWVLRANQKKCLPRYLHYLVQSRAFQVEANRPTGTKMPRADWDCVRRAPLSLPDIHTQKQICTSLDAIDNENHGLAACVELLRKQKRGLMQKLLTGEIPVLKSIDRLMPDSGLDEAVA